MEGTYTREELEGRGLVIYTPMSYGEVGRRFPVVYLQDEGDMLDHTLNYLEHLFLTGELPELILVGIVSPDRNHEYTPWPAPALASGFGSFGGGGEDYLREVAEVIKPYIDRNYCTLPQPEHTGIMGSSFGGLISLYAGYRYPELFGKIGLISASFWYQGLMEYMENHRISAAGHRMYMYVGELEGFYKTNIQKQMVSNTRKAYKLLQEQGLTEQELRFETHPEGTHDTVFFGLQFPEALKWLFGVQEAVQSEQALKLQSLS